MDAPLVCLGELVSHDPVSTFVIIVKIIYYRGCHGSDTSMVCLGELVSHDPVSTFVIIVKIIYCHGSDHMILGFTTTYATSVYHH